MRRILFNLTIAFLAFGIGSFFVFDFYWRQNKKQTETSLEIFETKPENKSLPTIVDKNANFKVKEDFKCTDKFLLTVWNDLRKDADFKEMSNKRIEEGVVNCSEIIEVDKLIDLNNDGEKEAIIVGNDIVNGAQNRAFWIVGKSKGKLKILLQESQIGYEIEKNATNGFRDILIKSRASCCLKVYKSVYKFRKTKYVENSCFLIEYQEKGEKIISTCTEDFENINNNSK